MLCSSTLKATTVVAITTGTEAYIGADSRAVGSASSACKLVARSGVAVGASGHLADLATRFNAVDSIRAALDKSHDFDSAIEGVIAELEPPLQRAMMWGSRNAPDEYQRKYQGKLALAVLLVGIRNHVPDIVYVAWRTDDGFVSRTEPRHLGANNFDAIGSHENIQKYIRRNPQWNQRPAGERVKTLLEIESDAQPAVVGKPFSLVRVDESGIHWIKRGACARAWAVSGGSPRNAVATSNVKRVRTCVTIGLQTGRRDSEGPHINEGGSSERPLVVSPDSIWKRNAQWLFRKIFEKQFPWSRVLMPVRGREDPSL